MLDILLVTLGFIGLVLGGNALVTGAVGVARHFGISPIVIGLTLVGFGTSMPELVTSVQAAYSGSVGIAVGNVVGSNIANILLILGVSALLAPIAVDARAFKRDGTMLAIATVLTLALVIGGFIGRGAGGLLVAALVAYVAYTLRAELRSRTPAGDLYDDEAATIPETASNLANIIRLIAGLAVTIISARLLVTGAISLSTTLGISDTVIGLTVVAIGTSLPELITSVIAAKRGQSDVAFGNIIGSNIFNLLGILGTTAILTPIAVPAEILRMDIWVMVAATVLMLVFARTGWHLSRKEGIIFLALYAAYTTTLVVLNS
ncbi:calcium/sodium antiporter [Celeribacter arenosi]|uniref:Calcium/sodium antiporter n=1 Tax=Celeribacter arenosi TaxID=792649 RepID=A0ABP7JZN9_9RHOB